MNSEIANKASAMSQEMQARLSAIMERSKACDVVMETKMDKMIKSSSQSNGIMFQVLVDYAKEGKKSESEQKTVASPAKIRFEVISLPTSVSPVFGVIEQDSAHEDGELKDVPVVDVHNRHFDMASQSRGVKVLKVKVRYGFDPTTLTKYGKETPTKNRPVYRVMYVYAGDMITGSIFQVEKPTVEIGGLAVVRGARCSAYFMSDKQVTGVSWNLNSVERGHGKLEDVITEKILTPHLHIPRNKHSFMKIEEPPIDYESGDYSQQLSPSLKEFLDRRVLFASWPTTFVQSGEEPTPEVMAATEKHLGKKYNIVWKHCKFTHIVDDYMLKVTKDNKDTYYLGLKFRQMSIVTDSTGDQEKEVYVLHEMDVLQRQARQALGISSPGAYSRIAPIHAPELRFLVVAKPNQKKSFESDMNSDLTRDEDTGKFDYKIVWTPPKTGFFHSNLRWYVTEHGYPVTFDFVKEIVGKGSTVSKSEFSETNFYNNVPGTKFFNLTEYTGDLNEFANDYVFFVLDSRDIDQDRLERVKSIPDFVDRAAKCTASLLGKVTRDADPVRLGEVKGKEPNVYALHKSLYEAIQENPGKYSLEMVKDHIEKLHLDTDPADDIAKEKDNLQKRKREEETYDVNKHFRATSDAPTTSLAQVAAQVADEDEDEDEASV